MIEESSCSRPYTLGKRAEQSSQRRQAVLEAARAQLALGGYANLTMDTLARDSGVTRQTVHNLFKTKTGVLEALFDQIAIEGGMEQMARVMGGMARPETSPEMLLEGFVRVFTGFWSRERLLIRRIHGIAAIEPELGALIEARNQRRRGVATSIVRRLRVTTEEQGRKAVELYALTSFEFFDIYAESADSLQEAADGVLALVKRALMPDPKPLL